MWRWCCRSVPFLFIYVCNFLLCGYISVYRKTIQFFRFYRWMFFIQVFEELIKCILCSCPDQEYIIVYLMLMIFLLLMHICISTKNGPWKYFHEMVHRYFLLHNLWSVEIFLNWIKNCLKLEWELRSRYFLCGYYYFCWHYEVIVQNFISRQSLSKQFWLINITNTPVAFKPEL